MNPTTSERLLILKRRQHHEYDAIITVFSPQRGRLNLLARGLSRPQSKLAGHLEPLTVIDGLIVWSQRPLLSAAVSRQSFINLKSQLAAVVLASQLINRYQRWCPTGQSMPRAWRDLVDLLNQWDQSAQSLIALTMAAQLAQWRLAETLGYLPNLEYCTKCHQTLSKVAWWSQTDGGLFCHHCRPATESIALSPESRNYWQLALKDGWLELTKSALSPTILEQTTVFFNGWLNFLDHYVC